MFYRAWKQGPWSCKILRCFISVQRPVPGNEFRDIDHYKLLYICNSNCYCLLITKGTSVCNYCTLFCCTQLSNKFDNSHFFSWFRENAEYRTTFDGKISNSLFGAAVDERKSVSNFRVCKFNGAFGSFGLVVETNEPKEVALQRSIKYCPIFYSLGIGLFETYHHNK